MQDNKQLIADAEFYIQKHALPESTNEGFHLIDRFIDALKDSEQKIKVAVKALESIRDDIEVQTLKMGDFIWVPYVEYVQAMERLDSKLNTIKGKD